MPDPRSVGCDVSVASPMPRLRRIVISILM